ncbi:MAG: DUF1854 domain-containing protein [Planctomycetia bacterium]
MTLDHDSDQVHGVTGRWRLERHAHGRLSLIDSAGVQHHNVDVLRGFPITAPRGSVAIVAADGTELAWIDSLESAPGPLREMLEQELSQREFLPVIERIETVSDGEPAEWSVMTDRGPRRFKVAHADDIARLPDDSAFVTDIDGIRYRIESLARLPLQDRRMIEKMY